MHAARLDRSSRLQRVHELLSDGAEWSTLDIVREAEVCAVNSIVAELRHAGAEIECRQSVSGSGQRVWLYRMTKPADDTLARGAGTGSPSGCNEPPVPVSPDGRNSTRSPGLGAAPHPRPREFRQLGLFA